MISNKKKIIKSECIKINPDLEVAKLINESIILGILAVLEKA